MCSLRDFFKKIKCFDSKKILLNCRKLLKDHIMSRFRLDHFSKRSKDKGSYNVKI